MRSARAGAPGWEIERPSRPGRLPGVKMAGFSDQTMGLGDIRVIPHPDVMLVIDIGGGLLADEEGGSRQRSSIVAGLAPIGAAGRGGAQSFECLQVRLSPVTAHAVLGDCAQLSGTIVALDDLWGRETARIQEQVSAAASWEDRFAIAESALVRRQEAGRAVDPEVAFAWRQLLATRGQIRIEQ